MTAKKSWKDPIRSLFPKEPRLESHMTSNPPRAETRAELDRKMRKTGWIANSVLFLVFVGYYFLVAQPSYHYKVSFEVTASTLSLFTLTLVIANLIVYRHYNRQMTKGEA